MIIKLLTIQLDIISFQLLSISIGFPTSYKDENRVTDKWSEKIRLYQTFASMIVTVIIFIFSKKESGHQGRWSLLHMIEYFSCKHLSPGLCLCHFSFPLMHV